MGTYKRIEPNEALQLSAIQSRNTSALIESAAELMLSKGEIDETLLQAIKDSAEQIKESMDDLSLRLCD